MKVDIYYCAAWNFKPQAVSLAVEIQKTPGMSVQLIPGSNGIFDVIVDMQRWFSKAESGRFPEPGEITVKLKRGTDWFEIDEAYAL